MKAGLSGDLRSLRQFSADLRRLPLVVAQKVTAKAAPAITALARATFEAGQDAFGIAWRPGVHGQSVTLRKSGDMAKSLVYVAIGTLLRVKLGVDYAKYQIGKRPVFPTQAGLLPAEYTRTLERTAVDVVRAELGVPR